MNIPEEVKFNIDPLKCLENIESFCKGRMKLLKKDSDAFFAYRDVKYLTHQYLRSIAQNEKSKKNN